ESIEKWIENEAKRQYESEYRNQLPSVGLPTIHSTFFLKIDEALKKYLTFEALICQKLQISQSCLYCPYQINFLTLSQNDYSEYTSGFIEDDYQESRVLLPSMLKLISNQTILEIWHIRLFSAPASHNGQYIIVLDNEIQNDKSNSSFDIIEELREPDCFNYEIQQYISKKAEYCQGIGIAKKEVQTALDTGTIDKFI
ncbi:32057_t:CDS:2, partial [Racocetra persica]